DFPRLLGQAIKSIIESTCVDSLGELPAALNALWLALMPELLARAEFVSGDPFAVPVVDCPVVHAYHPTIITLAFLFPHWAPLGIDHGDLAGSIGDGEDAIEHVKTEDVLLIGDRGAFKVVVGE